MDLTAEVVALLFVIASALAAFAYKFPVGFARVYEAWLILQLPVLAVIGTYDIAIGQLQWIATEGLDYETGARVRAAMRAAAWPTWPLLIGLNLALAYAFALRHLHAWIGPPRE